MKRVNSLILEGNKKVNLNIHSIVNDFAFLNPEFDFNENLTIIPGFCDVHVHFREPGFSYKETIETGSKSASRGGYTSVCTMPNLKPVPDTLENLNVQLELIKKLAVINVYPYASITKGQLGKELSDMYNLAPYSIAFSDDGRGVQDEKILENAMKIAKDLNKLIVCHCEVNDLLKGGYIHDGDYAKAHNHRGICSKSEYQEVERDIYLAKKTGVKLHICHISTKESVELIRNAKKSGIDVTCETAPHYLILDDSDLKESGDFKMNPPIRSKKDRIALVEGILDGTIDMIATDHAPHSLEEKSKGLEKSSFGIVGLETAFPLLYTFFVKTKLISINKLIDLMAINPRLRFNIPFSGFSVWNLNEEYTIKKEDFLSKGKSMPFENYVVNGVNFLTVINNKFIYKK